MWAVCAPPVAFGTRPIVYLHSFLRLLRHVELVVVEEQRAALRHNVQPVRPVLRPAERQPDRRERVRHLQEEVEEVRWRWMW